MARHHAHEQHGSRAHRHWWLLVALTLVVNVPDATAASEPICAIDMGSNTFRRIVGSFDNGRYSQAKDERITVGVGDDVASHGRISDSMLVEIEKVLSAFKAACAQESTAKVVAVGTAAFRDAPNGRQVVDIAASLGIPMEIATEKRESELAYLVGSFGRDDYAVIDNGSRSIELVSQHRETTRYLVMKLGYRVAYETFFAGADDPEAATIAFRDRLKREAAGSAFMKRQKKLIGVEFGDMLEVLFPPANTEGRVITLEVLKQKLREITASREAFNVWKKKTRIDRALPRLVVAVFALEEFGYSRLELTERELGAGLIIEAATRAGLRRFPFAAGR